MEAIALFFTKFSDELIGVQAALLCFSLSLALYWMLIRKKKRENAEWVPAALVKAYLDRMRSDEQETRRRLFGEESPSYSVQPSVTATLTQAVGADPNIIKELDALRAQLSMADQRSMEFDRMLNALRAEKSALEQKLREMAANPVAAAPGAAAAPSADFEAMKKAYEEAKLKLEEYSVIEDDLANVKKFQKENEQLKAKIIQLESGGAAVTTVVSGAAPAPEPVAVVPNATEKVTTPMTVITGGAGTTPAAAPAPAAETNTNVLAPVAVPAAAPEAAPAAAGGEKSPKQKEEELLSEFEKMLAS